MTQITGILTGQQINENLRKIGTNGDKDAEGIIESVLAAGDQALMDILELETRGDNADTKNNINGKTDGKSNEEVLTREEYSGAMEKFFDGVSQETLSRLFQEFYNPSSKYTLIGTTALNETMISELAGKLGTNEQEQTTIKNKLMQIAQNYSFRDDEDSIIGQPLLTLSAFASQTMALMIIEGQGSNGVSNGNQLNKINDISKLIADLVLNGKSQDNVVQDIVNLGIDNTNDLIQTVLNYAKSFAYSSDGNLSPQDMQSLGFVAVKNYFPTISSETDKDNGSTIKKIPDKDGKIVALQYTTAVENTEDTPDKIITIGLNSDNKPSRVTINANGTKISGSVSIEGNVLTVDGTDDKGKHITITYNIGDNVALTNPDNMFNLFLGKPKEIETREGNELVKKQENEDGKSTITDYKDNTRTTFDYESGEATVQYEGQDTKTTDDDFSITYSNTGVRYAESASSWLVPASVNDAKINAHGKETSGCTVTRDNDGNITNISGQLVEGMGDMAFTVNGNNITATATINGQGYTITFKPGTSIDDAISGMGIKEIKSPEGRPCTYNSESGISENYAVENGSLKINTVNGNFPASGKFTSEGYESAEARDTANKAMFDNIVAQLPAMVYGDDVPTNLAAGKYFTMPIQGPDGNIGFALYQKGSDGTAQLQSYLPMPTGEGSSGSGTIYMSGKGPADEIDNLVKALNGDIGFNGALGTSSLGHGIELSDIEFGRDSNGQYHIYYNYRDGEHTTWTPDINNQCTAVMLTTVTVDDEKITDDHPDDTREGEQCRYLVNTANTQWNVSANSQGKVFNAQLTRIDGGLRMSETDFFAFGLDPIGYSEELPDGSTVINEFIFDDGDFTIDDFLGAKKGFSELGDIDGISGNNDGIVTGEELRKAGIKVLKTIRHSDGTVEQIKVDPPFDIEIDLSSYISAKDDASATEGSYMDENADVDNSGQADHKVTGHATIKVGGKTHNLYTSDIEFSAFSYYYDTDAINSQADNKGDIDAERQAYLEQLRLRIQYGQYPL